MRITVLWEDERGEVAKGFGPHELLVACLADELEMPREQLHGRISSLPKKGRDKLREALKHELRRFARLGPVLAILDKDKVRDFWKGQAPPAPACMSGMTSRIHEDVPGDYDIVFIERNVDTLVDVVCEATGHGIPLGKQRPDRRDQLLTRAVWAGPPVRQAVRAACPSFDRLVMRVAAHLRP
jgi:hypothetical protein